ncbi:hypothetical protein [Hyalangium gracile]|uniref:hypothetical protein n=1 Tax=Hyalangium gracile TaxID=394092 RepID=UPI001CCA2928|nr:hypothetical protein [Hyalangium gracile]
MSDDQKSAEEKLAEYEALAERVQKTSEELNNLLRSVEALDPEDSSERGYELYEEARLVAEAGLLEQLCELVLPEIKLVARPIRAALAEPEPSESEAELEVLAGSLPARYRQAEWLDVPAFHLEGATNFLGAFTDAHDGDTGVMTSKAYYLLVDGRFVEVHSLGTWRVTGNELHDTRRTLVSTRVVTAKDVVAEVHFMDLLLKLRHPMRVRAQQAIEAGADRDVAERLAQFELLEGLYMELAKQMAEGLRRIIDGPS